MLTIPTPTHTDDEGATATAALRPSGGWALTVTDPDNDDLVVHFDTQEAAAFALAWLRELSGGTHVTLAEAGKALGVSPKTISRWIDSGLLKGTRTLGGTRRVSVHSLAVLIDRSGPVDEQAQAIAKVFADYDDWDADRADLSRREAGDLKPGETVPGDEWHGSDDTGIELLRKLVDLIR